MNPAVQQHAAPRKTQIITAVCIGIALYLGLEALDGFIAYPLREISARLSSWLLTSLSLPVTRTGTILATPSFTFDVVPACSGSTSLRALLMVGVIWCGIHPRLSMGRKLLCIVLAIPIALAANGLRVAALVGLGDLFLKPIEGFPHAMVGLLTFAFAMASVFLLTELLSSQQSSQSSKAWPALIAHVVLVVLLFMPVWVWFFDSWTTSRAEALATLFLIAGGVLLWRIVRKTVRSGTNLWIALSLHLLAMGFLAYATLIDVRTLQGAALLLTILALVYTLRGGKATVAALPLIAILGLGFPMSGYLIQTVFAKAGVTLSVPTIFVLKAVLSLGLAFLALRKREKLSRRETVLLTPQPLGGLILVSLITLGIQTYYTANAAAVDKSRQVQLSYVQGAWTGTDNRVSQVAEAVIGRERIVSRRYYREADYVDIIVTSTGSDRRRAHPPEGCMTGAGWSAKSQNITTLKLHRGSIPATRFVFAKDGVDVEFFYWFTDGEKVMASYNEMLREDLVRRVRGLRTNWFLFRVMADQQRDCIDDFLATLDAKFVIEGT